MAELPLALWANWQWPNWHQPWGFILIPTYISNESFSLLTVYLLSMLLCCFALGAQYALLVLFSFLDNPFSPTQLIFWTGLFPGSLLPATPISVLFLSLDRLLIVLLPSIYMRKATKLGLALASTLAIVGLFSLNFGVNFAQRPRKEVPGN
jgi:hypothetical protein